jgi:hypothetical protein
LASYNRFSIRPNFGKEKKESTNEKQKSGLEPVRRGSANVGPVSSGSLDELKHPPEITKSARTFLSPRKTQSEAYSLQDLANFDIGNIENEKTPNRKATTICKFL